MVLPALGGDDHNQAPAGDGVGHVPDVPTPHPDSIWEQKAIADIGCGPFPPVDVTWLLLLVSEEG